MSLPRRPYLLALLVIGALTGVFFAFRSREHQARFQTAAVERGDVAEVVGATGTLQAVVTVQVGSQVSGTIEQLLADFNSNVKKNAVIARLDPSLFDARLGQARANLVAARANAERARTALEDARLKYERAKLLSAEQLLPESDLETAKANADSAAAALKAAQAAVTQAEASVNQADVDLAHTVIRAPIDGVVVARNVDVGQTVAASFQAPVLFVIANDLTRMQVNASVDEADIGRVRPGQEVTFRVDAHAERVFGGRVEQVRLQPTVVQNVVTYNSIISVDNSNQLLMPGMTATVSIVARRSPNVLRVPAAALRFRPEGFGSGETRRGASAAAGGQSTAGAGRVGAPNGTGVPGAATERRRGPGAGGESRRSAEGAPGGGAEPANAGQVPAGGDAADADADTARPGIVFILGPDGKPEPRRVRLGLSDGQFVEIRSGLEEGQGVIVGVEGETTRGAPRPGGSPSTNPFNPQIQRRQR